MLRAARARRDAAAGVMFGCRWPCLLLGPSWGRLDERAASRVSGTRKPAERVLAAPGRQFSSIGAAVPRVCRHVPAEADDAEVLLEPMSGPSQDATASQARAARQRRFLELLSTRADRALGATAVRQRAQRGCGAPRRAAAGVAAVGEVATAIRLPQRCPVDLVNSRKLARPKGFEPLTSRSVV